MNSRNIITIDTGAGFLRSRDSELSSLRNIYDWIPAIVSCRNLSSGECFQYNTVTHKKEVTLPAKTSETFEDEVLIDTGAGFIRCTVAQLKELRATYPWIPEVVSCQNTNTSEQFQYHVSTQKAVGLRTAIENEASVNLAEEDSKDYLRMKIFTLEEENKQLNTLVSALRAEKRVLVKELERKSLKNSFSLFGTSHDDFYEFG